MKISQLAIKRPVTVLMMVMMILVLGAVSFAGLNLDLFPDISLPMAVVMTSYDGAGPHEIETLITRPLEQAMGTVDNFRQVSSTSSNGHASVSVQFAQGTNMDYAALEMREKVDMVRGMWPDEVGNPIIFQYDVGMMPIIQFGMSYGEDLATLKLLAEEKIKDRLERIDGVAAVEIVGGLEEEIKIDIIPYKMQGYGITLSQLSQLLRSENLNLPGGQLREGKNTLTVRTIGEFEDIEQIKNLPITTPGGIIQLQDTADVSQGYKDIDSRVLLNGNPCVLVQVRKQSGFNTVRVANSVNAALDEIKLEIEEVTFATIFDQSEFVKQALGSVTNNALVGGILAIFILFIFLKNMRTTFIIGTAIPISIIATFILIYFSGITLNMMSLGGLALGIGMLVDSAIVVLESIYRYREEGYSRVDAAREGTNEVAMAVVASTLTTIAVFLPIVFIKENIAIEMFRELALTVTFALLASLIISLTLVPMLASKILKIERMEDLKNKHTPIATLDRGFERAFRKIEEFYKRILTWAVNHRKTVIAGILLLFASSIGVAVMFAGAEFFPDTDEGMFTIEVQLPKGMSLEETMDVTRQVSEKMETFDELAYIFSVEGDDGDTSKATIFASFGPRSERDKDINILLDQARDKMQDIAGAQISVEKLQMMAMGGAGSKPIVINIKGEDLEVLEVLAEKVVTGVENISGTREVASSVAETVPEAQIKVNRSKAAHYGVSTYAVASTIQSAVMGQIATRYKIDGEEIDVRIRYQPESRYALEELRSIDIPTQTGQHMPLFEIADIEMARAPASIHREDQVRQVNVTGDISGRDSRSVFVDIQSTLDTMAMPQGYEAILAGENEELNDATKAFGLALILAVILVYMIMASQFESLLHPFTIMFSVPLAFIGISYAMVLTGKPFSVPAFTGLIMLAGIVVNNAIVLVDYINNLRGRGIARNEAIFKAGPVRLRPILMTTLTTVLGLTPLALGIGEGAELQAPMAITVIGGLSFSTLLTLVFIPVLYTLFDDFGSGIKRKFVRSS